MQQPGKQLVLAYGGWAVSATTHTKGIPPCMGKGLLKKLSRHFLVIVVPEHYTSQRCFHCGGKCGNHEYLAERDRRAQSDERLELQLKKRLERCETSEQRARSRAWFDCAMSRPCEIRGLRFCSGCQRCLNRDANSAPQMGVQLKRLMINAGPLHRLSKEDEHMQKISNAIECPDDDDKN